MSIAATILVTLLLVIGCHRQSDPTDIPVTEDQRKLAVAAVGQLREEFNQGACGSIYDEASEMFHSQSQEVWLVLCETFRGRLGSWQSIDVQSAVGCGGPNPTIVCVSGSSTFTNGTHTFEFAWLLETTTPRLCWFSLRDDDVWLTAPPWRPKRYYNPPPRDPTAPVPG